MMPTRRLRDRPSSYDVTLHTRGVPTSRVGDAARMRWAERTLAGLVVLVAGLGLAWLCVTGAREVANRIAARLHSVTVAEARNK